MYVLNPFIDLFVHVSCPPLLKQHTQYLGLKHSLKYESIHSRCKSILNVICERWETLFVDDIMSVIADTNNEMMSVGQVLEMMSVFLKAKGMRSHTGEERLFWIKGLRNIHWLLLSWIKLLGIREIKLFKKLTGDSWWSFDWRGFKTFTIRDEGELSPLFFMLILIKSRV